MQRRNTIQRNLVLNAVSELKCHATADEVYEYITASNPSVSRATVYRNLNLLAEEGSILKIEVPGGAVHFDHTLRDHYHMRCVRCGRLYDVDLDTMPDLPSHIRDSHGFDFLGCDITFKGICPECNLNKINNN